MLYCLGPGPLGCENRPEADAEATVGASGWLYELPLDGNRPALVDEIEFPVVGRAVPWPNAAFVSETERVASRPGLVGGAIEDVLGTLVLVGDTP